MKIIEKRYYHIKGTVSGIGLGIGKAITNYVKADVYYDDGSRSIMAGRRNPRGYWLSISKVGRGKDDCGWWESTAIYGNAGCKQLIFETTRQSKKREAEAVEYFRNNIDRYIAQMYQGIEVELETEV